MDQRRPHFDKPRPAGFPRWLTSWRIRRDLKQSELAARVGWNPGRVSELETGKRKPTATQIDVLRIALNADEPERS